MKINEGTEQEVTLRVVIESVEQGREYFDQYESVIDMIRAVKGIVERAIREGDGFERIVGIAIVPKANYGDEDGYGFDLGNDE
jgi:hypothetical protein